MSDTQLPEDLVTSCSNPRVLLIINLHRIVMCWRVTDKLHVRWILSRFKKERKEGRKRKCATKVEILPSFKPVLSPSFVRLTMKCAIHRVDEGRRKCIAKGYSTIAWTPFFLKITMRCTWPLGALIVCSTSCNTERTQSYFFFLQMSRYWKDADSIVAFHGICSDKVIYHSSPYHTWISISKGLDREKKEEELIKEEWKWN